MEITIIKEVECLNEPQSCQYIIIRGRDGIKTKQWHGFQELLQRSRQKRKKVSSIYSFMEIIVAKSICVVDAYSII